MRSFCLKLTCIMTVFIALCPLIKGKYVREIGVFVFFLADRLS